MALFSNMPSKPNMSTRGDMVDIPMNWIVRTPIPLLIIMRSKTTPPTAIGSTAAAMISIHSLTSVESKTAPLHASR